MLLNHGKLELSTDQNEQLALVNFPDYLFISRPAFKKWKEDKYLEEATKDATFNCGGYRVTYQDYLRYQNTEKLTCDMPLYLFDKKFCQVSKQWICYCQI